MAGVVGDMQCSSHEFGYAVECPKRGGESVSVGSLEQQTVKTLQGVLSELLLCPASSP